MTGAHLSGVSMLPARGTERPDSAKSREKTSNLALVLGEGEGGGMAR